MKDIFYRVKFLPPVKDVEPRTVAWEVRMLLLCYAVPSATVVLSSYRNELAATGMIIRADAGTCV